MWVCYLLFVICFFVLLSVVMCVYLQLGIVQRKGEKRLELRDVPSWVPEDRTPKTATSWNIWAGLYRDGLLVAVLGLAWKQRGNSVETVDSCSWLVVDVGLLSMGSLFLFFLFPPPPLGNPLSPIRLILLPLSPCPCPSLSLLSFSSTDVPNLKSHSSSRVGGEPAEPRRRDPKFCFDSLFYPPASAMFLPNDHNKPVPSGFIIVMIVNLNVFDWNVTRQFRTGLIAPTSVISALVLHFVLFFCVFLFLLLVLSMSLWHILNLILFEFFFCVWNSIRCHAS